MSQNFVRYYFAPPRMHLLTKSNFCTESSLMDKDVVRSVPWASPWAKYRRVKGPVTIQPDADKKLYNLEPKTRLAPNLAPNTRARPIVYFRTGSLHYIYIFYIGSRCGNIWMNELKAKHPYPPPSHSDEYEARYTPPPSAPQFQLTSKRLEVAVTSILKSHHSY